MTLPAADGGRTRGRLGIGEAGVVCLTLGCPGPFLCLLLSCLSLLTPSSCSSATGLCYVPQASPQHSCFIFKCSVGVSLFSFFGELGQTIKKGNATNLRRVRSENISECVRQWRNYLLYENWANNHAFRDTGRTHCPESRHSDGGGRTAVQVSSAEMFLSVFMVPLWFRQWGWLANPFSVVRPQGRLGNDAVCPGSLYICFDRSAPTEGENVLLYLKGVLWEMCNLESSLDTFLELRNNLFLRYKSHMLNDFIL